MTLYKNLIKPVYLPNNYRPIALLNIISQIIEAIIVIPQCSYDIIYLIENFEKGYKIGT